MLGGRKIAGGAGLRLKFFWIWMMVVIGVLIR